MSSGTAEQQPKSIFDRFRIPPGQSLIWWLIEMQRGWLAQIIAFALFLLSFRYIFAWSWSMSIAMILSMYLHECGHALVFWRNQIRFLILFLFPLGAVAAPIDKAENERSDQLHWNTVSWLLQAGIIVNVALMLIGLALQRAPVSADLLQFARDLVYVNGLLSIMNLVPLWTLDSGQLFNVIFNSLEEPEDVVLTGALLIVVALLLVFILQIPDFVSLRVVLGNALSRFGWVLFLLIFAIGVINKQAHDKPDYAYSKLAMTNGQVIVQLGVYVILVGATLWIFAGALF
jgi:Zn-dependent protease